MGDGTLPSIADLARRALPFLRDEAAKYDDDGSNEPLELAREIEAAIAQPASEQQRHPDALPDGSLSKSTIKRVESETPRLSEITRLLIARDQRGREKYGTTLDRADLSLSDWLQHMAEELMDAAGYALAAKRTAALTEAKQQGPEGAVAEVRKGSIENFVFCPDPNSLPVGTKLYTAPQVEAKRKAGEGADHG